jgi:pyridoxal 5'-phosphate synthase pdxT subunit
MLRKAGAEAREVRTAADLELVDGLIIPGGESTTVSKLMRRYGLDAAIEARYRGGRLAVYGTCMGLIVASGKIRDYPELVRLGFLDVTVERNAYGPQVESFESDIEIDTGNGTAPFAFHAVFIRAPQVVEVGPGVKVHAAHGGRPALVSQGRCLGGTFHPELTDDDRVHRFFIDKFVGCKKQ